MNKMGAPQGLCSAGGRAHTLFSSATASLQHPLHRNRFFGAQLIVGAPDTKLSAPNQTIRKRRSLSREPAGLQELRRCGHGEACPRAQHHRASCGSLGGTRALGTALGFLSRLPQ